MEGCGEGKQDYMLLQMGSFTMMQVSVFRENDIIYLVLSSKVAFWWTATNYS